MADNFWENLHYPEKPITEKNKSDNWSFAKELRKAVLWDNDSEFTPFQRNMNGIKWALSMLRYWSHFWDQSLENLRGSIDKPQDDLHHWKNAKTVILIPGFLCNQWVMRQLWDSLSKSMNVVYPDIGIVEQLYKSLPELADKISRLYNRTRKQVTSRKKYRVYHYRT